MTGPDRSVLLAGDDHLGPNAAAVAPVSCIDSRPSSPPLDAALVQQVARDTRGRFDGHPTREFVPILVEDSARDRLRMTPASSTGATPRRG